MMRDATAGARMMWPNKNPPYTVFLDRNTDGPVPPHIYGDYRRLPFRDDVFDCVIFDPPHAARNKQYKKFNWTNREHPSYYGWDITKTELLSGIAKAQKEIARVSKRLCFKWGEVDWTLWQILPLFRPWKEINRKLTNAGRVPTWWVTFVRSRH